MNGVKKILSVTLALLLCGLCLIPALALEDPASCAHTWVWVTDEAATCAPGCKHLYCAKCGSVSAENTEIPAVAQHVWAVSEVQPPEACKDGYYRYTCANCGAQKETVYRAEADHSWQWVVDMPPTRYNPGAQHEECSVCHAVRNQNTAIPATEQGFDFGAAMHQWIDIIGNYFLNIINQIRALFQRA